MKPYYEGWYMKQQQGDDVISLIAGHVQTEAFIQVVTKSNAHYFSYPLEMYRKEKRPPAWGAPRQTAALEQTVRIGNNLFSPQGVKLCIHKPGVDLEANLHYRSPTPPRFVAMGPFELIPLQTRHTIFSMRHYVDGYAKLNDQVMIFNNGTGYMEGDQGRTFPRHYTWIQSSDLPKNTSVVLAIADVPVGTLHFVGCVAIVSLNGKEYRFATYQNVRVMRCDKNAVRLSQNGMTLNVSILKAPSCEVQIPHEGTMDRSIQESLAASAHFVFTNRGKTLLDCVSHNTSYEYVS